MGLLYLNINLDKLSEEQKKEVETVENRTVFYLKELTTSNKIWKGVSLFLALLLFSAIILLSFFELNSRPDYMFSLWLFLAVEAMLALFVVFFTLVFFDGLIARMHKNKYYIIITDNMIIIRKGSLATLIPWKNITDYNIDRRDTDNFVTSIRLVVESIGDSATPNKVVVIPKLFLDNFNKVYGLIYHHVKKHKAQNEETANAKEWPIVIGLSVKNEKLPENILSLLKIKQKGERTLYFEAKENYFLRIFLSVLFFVLSFGFIMTIFDLFNVTNFWGMDFTKYNYNIKLFISILLSLFIIGGLSIIIVNLVKIIHSKKQQLIVTKDGLIEKIFDIVYVIPWKSVKDISTKWFSYGVMDDKGEMKIQIIYNEKPKCVKGIKEQKEQKETKADRIYNLQGGYHIEPNQLLNMMKEYWKGKE
ncbi:MAG: hypothetical protein ABIG89_04300 [Candidatus Woesearchaeota archaeon]